MKLTQSQLEILKLIDDIFRTLENTESLVRSNPVLPSGTAKFVEELKAVHSKYIQE
jgi:hypothetical protein